jgi:hypothetical protein
VEDHQQMNKRHDVVTLRLVDMATENVSIPLVKMYTCGGLRIEVLQHPAETAELAQYTPITSHHLIGAVRFPRKR